MKNKGFTLVELSIVLAILGLLAGGVLVGKNLIKAAELRDFITSADTIKAATSNFRTKYSALPGDMSNATAFWGTQDADATACQTSPSTSPATCNGDGNNAIDIQYETFRYWQHLANAGLIKGSYSGIGGGGVSGVLPGNNVYALKRPSMGISVLYYSDASVYSCGALCNGSTNRRNLHILIIGASQWNVNTMGFNAMSAVEAFNMDTKIDDGLPFSGTMFTDPYAGNNSCTTNTTFTYNTVNEIYMTGSGSNIPGCRAFIDSGF